MELEAEFLNPSQEIPQSMPILDAWLKTCPGGALTDTTALFIQHQFGNQVPQANALLKLGLNPRRLFWLDVPYTSNPLVRDALVALRIPRKNFICSDDYWVLDPYAPYQRNRVQALLKDLLRDPPNRLLVLDDGAYFLEAAACFADRLPSVAVVEQTERGFIKLESSAAMRKYARTIPIVDVARSEAKKTLEPPFIAKAVCAALYRKIEKLAVPVESGNCLILGYGAIGSQVARFAADNLEFARDRVFVFDTRKDRRENAQNAGFSLWQKDDFRTLFTMVVGCTGQASFGVYDHVYLENGAILASASSGSVELSRESFIELADSSRIDDIRILRNHLNAENIHSDIQFQLVDRQATFLNGGFPVNFDGHINCVPLRYMQPTVTMMVAASVQAVASMGSHATGRIDLERGVSDWLDERFRAELGPEAAKWLPADKKAPKVAGA